MAGTASASDLNDNLDIDSLDLDLEALDDEEYDLPPVDKTPTLESILNDLNDRTSLSEDELSNVLMTTGEAGFDGSETQSLCSVDTRSRSSLELRSSSRRRTATTSGSILRHVILKGISSQLTSACERIDAGFPTAMAVTTMIAVGTSHSLVLLFDSTQTLRWCLGASERDQGSVSSLGFNNDCTRLLAGYARGNVLMFDVQAGKLLRTMTDVHAPATAVLHVKFTDSPTLALCSDSGGSVFELNFRRTMGVRGCDSKCLFSGSRGEVVCLEPLLLDQFVSHPLGGAVLIAMATLSKVLVVSIRPRTRVVFTHPLVGDSTTLPLLAWQFVVIQMADGTRVVDPVLAFARDSALHFYQVCTDSRGRPRLATLQQLTVNYSLLSLRWLNSRTMAALDTLEQLHLVDVRTREELDCVDLASVGLVYATSHFKGLATGGNVSKALALAGERACYNSVLSFGNQLLLLGTKTFHVLSIRSWTERLDLLTKQKRYVDALMLGVSFYLDQGKAVVGLKGPKHKRKEIAKDKVLEILHDYIDTALRPDASLDLLHEAIPACIEYCIQLNILDVLFGKLWDGCADVDTARGIYLVSLEPWVLGERITSLPPAITQQLVGHYEQCDMLVALEAILVRLDVASLDVDQVMRLSQIHGLLDARIHVYNRGLADYLTPLLDLLKRLQGALATGKQLTARDIALGNKLLVYISCCLAGRAYPSGDIPTELVRSVKHEVFKCLTCLHAQDASDSELPYPYLRALLHFDSAEFMNVIALALEETEFTTEMGRRQVQRLVDILVQIMIQGEGFTGGQVSNLVSLISRQLAHGLHLERGTLEQAAQLIAQGSKVQHEARQTALLELMRADALQHCDKQWLLELATNASFYRVCELIYEEREEYDQILHCYLRDPLRKSQVFSYLRNLLLLSKDENRAKVETQIIENIDELLAIDWAQTGELVRTNVPHIIGELATRLKDKDLFRLLQGLLECKEETVLEPHLVEQYIDLLCQYDADRVHSFVSSTDTYRLDQALKIVQKWNLIDATAYLLEKAGDFPAALQLVLERLERKFGREDMSELVVGASDLCRRASATLDENGRRGMWLPLLETVLRHEQTPTVRAVTQQLLASMSGFVALPAVVQAVLKDPAYAGGKFGDIRDLVMGMLAHSNYEKTLLQSTSRLHSTDLHQKLAGVLMAANKGLSSRSTHCSMCRKPLRSLNESDNAVLFRCGHGYHSSCLEPSIRCCLCSNDVGSNASTTLAWHHPSAVSSITGTTDVNNTAGLLHSQDFELRLAPPPMPPDLEGIF